MIETDSELWQKVIAGDNNAWAELIRRYRKLVYAVACRTGLTMIDAADCFQQTWVLLYRNRDRLRDPDRLASWLMTTARREALRLKREPRGNPGQPDLENISGKNLLPDEELEKLERQVQLEIALEELGSRCRQIVDLFFFSSPDKSYEDIARALGISPNSLGPLRRRCLDRLKKILIKNGFWEVRKKE